MLQEFLAFTIETGIVATRKNLQQVQVKYTCVDEFMDVTTRAPIASIQYFAPPLDCIAVIEQRSSKVRLYSSLAMRHLCDVNSWMPRDAVAALSEAAGGGGGATSSGGGSSAAVGAATAVGGSRVATIPEVLMPGIVIAQTRRDKASSNDFVAPFVNACTIAPEHGMLALAQSNNMISLWTTPALAAHASSLSPEHDHAAPNASSGKHGAHEASRTGRG
ncbi:hypothetical protein EON66_06420, partial [archaeon]